MNNNEFKKKINPFYSWPVIIISVIIFWPVSIFLLYMRVKTDKRAGFTTGRIVKYISFVCFFMVAIGILASLMDGFGSDDVGLITFFLIAGVVLLLFSKKLISNAEKYKKYISIIINGNEYIIENIAGSMSLSVDVVRKDLNDMINNGYFQGAYINNSTNEIILPRQNKEVADDSRTSGDIENTPSRAVTCSCCGAQNNVTASNTECEYCGSPL